MTIKNHLLGLVQVHQQAYARIFSALEAVSDTDYFADKRLFFSSIHGTLNHCLLVDTLWYFRLLQQRPPFTMTGLDMTLHDTREALQVALSRQAEKLFSFVGHSEDTVLNKTLIVKTSSGMEIHHPVSWLVATVVNHGTHHRGQITAVLTQMGLTFPALDLPFYENLPPAQ
ncbi:MAG TPA: hypothetical protein ENI62_05725 [Gammaproteobacteria bacterium]|nr:hypothetical protein [Gammaproteobacteria bacterium]